MGADRALIAAAGKMGPAKVDYSGYMNGIAAIGKYVSTKNSIANNYIAERPDGIDISELPEEMRTETNMAYFTDGKKRYNAAVKTIKNAPAFSKKYKNAVEELNVIKKGFEKVKGDLVTYANWRTKVFTEHTTLSKQTNAKDSDFFSGMVIDEGSMNSAAVFSDDGVSFGKDNISINDLPSPTTSASGIKAGGLMQEIILKSGRSRKEQNKNFDQDATRSEIQLVVDSLLSQGGYKAVKSLAFDAKFNGETFMQSYLPTLRDWDEEYKGWLSSEEGQNASEATKTRMKQNAAAEAWGANQNEELTNGLVEHIYGLAEKSFGDAKKTSINDKSGKRFNDNQAYSIFGGDGSMMGSELNSIFEDIEDGNNFQLNKTQTVRRVESEFSGEKAWQITDNSRPEGERVGKIMSQSMMLASIGVNNLQPFKNNLRNDDASSDRNKFTNYRLTKNGWIYEPNGKTGDNVRVSDEVADKLNAYNKNLKNKEEALKKGNK